MYKMYLPFFLIVQLEYLLLKLQVLLYILLLLQNMYISLKILKTLKLCSNVSLGQWYIPYVVVIFLTNVSALIASAEWLDFYDDSEGVLM